MKKLEKLAIKKAVENELSKAISRMDKSRSIFVDKRQLIQSVSNHDFLFKLSYERRNCIVVGCVWKIAEEYRKDIPAIYIAGYPVFGSTLDGWLISTNRSIAEPLAKEITSEDIRKGYRKAGNHAIRLEEKVSIARNYRILTLGEIRIIEEEEIKVTEERKLNPPKLKQ